MIQVLAEFREVALVQIPYIENPRDALRNIDRLDNERFRGIGALVQ